MAIIHFTHNFRDIPADAINLVHKHDSFDHYVYLKDGEDRGHYDGRAIGPSVLSTWHTHVGLCLRDTEHNSYHDSDFYMLVWNEEKGAPESICFASTRGWSYPAYGSFVDATDEVKAKYAAWCKARDEKLAYERKCAKLKTRLAQRATAQKIAREYKINYAKLLKLRRVYGDAKLDAILSLFSNRVKSGFKISLRLQLVKWLRENDPVYAKPFSPRQADYL